MASSFRATGRKIVAIGRNYADHAKELNNKIPTEPFFFLKPTTSYLDNGGTIEIPKGVQVHFEGELLPRGGGGPCDPLPLSLLTTRADLNFMTTMILRPCTLVELGLVIGKGGRDISQADALSHIGGYALAIDMTARNMQEKVKKAGLPWSAAKGFDTFNPVSSFVPLSAVPDAQNLRLLLLTNGKTRQDGNTSGMIFRIPKLIEHISSIMTLEDGDLILTGTPAGVGETKPGDDVYARLEVPGKEPQLLAELKLKVARREKGYTFAA